MTKKQWLLAVAALLLGGVAFTKLDAGGKAPDAAAAETVRLAREVYAEIREQVKNGQAFDNENWELWSRNLLGAELRTAANPDDRLAAHQGHVDRTKEIERLAKAYQQSGQGRNSDALAATFYRLEAERELAAARAK